MYQYIFENSITRQAILQWQMGEPSDGNGKWQMGEPSEGTNFGSTANPGIGSQFGQRRTG
jgi:hypothetical protein